MLVCDHISELHEENSSTHIFEILRRDKDSFADTVGKIYGLYFTEAGLIADIDTTRLYEAFVLWKNDLDRVKTFELPDSDELDHLKQSAHLAYWLRRVSPILSIQYAEENSTEQEIAEQELLFKYGNQYCAYHLGFRICAYFEANRVDSEIYSSDYDLNHDYKVVVSHFLKTKNVSPHALFLIYKSLFFKPLIQK